ncbi:MAG: protein kinase [Polyangiales bacterium]
MWKATSLAGQVIDARYAIQSYLGGGTFGVVWSALDAKIPGRSVAVKLLREEYAGDPQVVARFQTEARALGALRHPGIAAFLDQGAWQGCPYLVMERVDGVTLAAWLDAHRAAGAPPPHDAVWRLFDNLCAAVAAAHAAAPGPIVHRDLKPSNVMLRPPTSEGRVAVLDFGVAQFGARGGTQTGARVGTLAYMAPEQATGNVAAVGPWTDVFSLACLLFEALTLRQGPTAQDTFWGLAMRGPAHVAATLDAHRGQLPGALIPVLLHAFRAAPHERPPHAAALRDMLRAAWPAPAAPPGADATLPMPVGPGPSPMLPQNSTPYPVAPLFSPGGAAPPHNGAVSSAGGGWSGPTAQAARPSGADAILGMPPPWYVAQGGQRPSQNRSFVPRSALRDEARRGRLAWAGSVAAGVCGVAAFIALVTRLAGHAPAGGEAALRDCDHGGPEACLQDGLRLSDGPVPTRDDARALRAFRVACDARLPEGCFRTGRALEQGRGVGRDYARAASDYGVACERGHLPSCTRLAGLLFAGRGGPRDEARARGLLTRACDGGELQACNDLGDVHRDGRGVPRDLAKALELHQRACSGGNLEGCDSVGMAYREGYGVAVDLPRAVQLFEHACNGGNMEACGDLGDLTLDGRGVERNPQRALDLLRRSCDGGYDQGCVQLGELHALGGVVARDEGAAAAYYQRACDRDWGPGCNALGVAHYDGRGVVQNRALAARLYQRACDADAPWGCHNYAGCLENGEGVARAEQAAPPLYERACAAGIGPSCSRLGYMSREGVTLARSLPNAYSYYARGCDASDARSCNESCYMAQHAEGGTVETAVTLQLCQRACNLDDQYCNNLAFMYGSGAGVERDERQAAVLYRRACEARQPNATACRNLADFYLTGRGVRANRTEAIRLLRRACQLGHTGTCTELRAAGIALR